MVSFLLPALRAAIAVDRRAFLPLRGLRAATAVALALGTGVSIGQPAAGVLAAVGALTAGTVSLTQGARTPLGTMVAAGAATALSTAVGSLVAHAVLAELIALAVWGAAAGLLAGAGPAAAVVGVQAVVGLVVLGRYPLTPSGALAAAGEVLIGSAGQVLLCALLRVPARSRVERQTLAALADQLAAWCRDPGGAWTSRTAAGLEDARTLLDRHPHGTGSAPLRSVLLGLARSRLEVSVLCLAHERERPRRELPERELPERERSERKLPESELPERELLERELPEHELPERELPVRELPEPEQPPQMLQQHGVAGSTRVARLLAAAAADLAGLADALRRGRDDGAAGDAWLAPLLEQSGPGPGPSPGPGPGPGPGPDELAVRRARALAGQLRGARVSLAAWADARVAPGEVLRAARPHRAGQPGPAGYAPRPHGAGRRGPAGHALRHPSPAAGRHAVRLAVLLPLAEAVARLLPLQRGYWVALTAVVVLKPDYATSSRRSLGRVVGTLLGVVPVTLLVGIAHPRGLPLVLLVAVLAWGAYASFQASFALYSGWLAGLVVVLLDVVTPAGTAIAGARALDTLLGGGLALLGFLLLPAWEGPALQEAVAALIDAEDRYAGKLLAAYGEDPPSREVMATGARQVRQARAAAETSLGRAAAEPARTGSPGQAERARDVLAGTARVASSLHVLHAQAIDGVDRPATAAELAPFAEGLHLALVRGADQVRSGREHAQAPDLRAAGSTLLGLVEHGSPARRVLAGEAEELIDAVDTLLFATGLRADRARTEAGD